MNTWKVVLATLVIFVAGLVTGGLLVGYAERAPLKHHRLLARDVTAHRLDGKQTFTTTREPFALPKMAGAMPQGLRMDFLKNLDHELQFTEEQRTRIEKIITEGQEQNKQLWNRVLPEMRREMQTTRERIRAELKPEQIKRFEELMKQRPQRKGDEPMMQPDRRLRDQTRRPLPSRDGPLPEGVPQPRPPTEPLANP